MQSPSEWTPGPPRAVCPLSPGREGAICGGMRWVPPPLRQSVPYEGTLLCLAHSPGGPAGREPVPLLLKICPALCHADVLTFYGEKKKKEDHG